MPVRIYPPRTMTRSTRGFTLLELVVVLTIIALIATMTVPRLWDMEERRFNQAVEQVADLMIGYAQRDALGAVRVGILYDPSRHEIMLVAYEPTDEDGRHGGWFRDSLNRAVRLPSDLIRPNEDVWARENGDYYDFSSWPLTSDPNTERPHIQITLVWENREAVIDLPSHAIAPRIQDSRRPRGAAQEAAWQERQAIDMDRQGRDREEW